MNGTKVHTNKAKVQAEVVSLDKLAQLGTDITRDDLRKRARSKYFSSNLATRLAFVPDSHLTKSYWNTYHCASTIVQEGLTISSKYCNNRWCTTCNRIRTANLVNGYSEPLKELTDKHFVTLTVPNVPGDALKATIDDMNACFKAICETYKRRKQRGKQTWQIKGIKKIECTYNPIRKDFHPHFHVIVEGKECAENLVNDWLIRNPKSTLKAQDLRAADDKSVHELFKYFAKLVTKTGKEHVTHVKPLDTIFQAMWGLRVFQPIGIKKDVTEDIEGIQKQNVVDIDYEEDIKFWRWEYSDWVDNNGEAMTGYLPSEQMDKLIDNMKVDADQPKEEDGQGSCTTLPDNHIFNSAKNVDLCKITQKNDQLSNHQLHHSSLPPPPYCSSV